MKDWFNGKYCFIKGITSLERCNQFDLEKNIEHLKEKQIKMFDEHERNKKIPSSIQNLNLSDFKY